MCHSYSAAGRYTDNDAFLSMRLYRPGHNRKNEHSWPQKAGRGHLCICSVDWLAMLAVTGAGKTFCAILSENRTPHLPLRYLLWLSICYSNICKGRKNDRQTSPRKLKAPYRYLPLLKIKLGGTPTSPRRLVVSGKQCVGASSVKIQTGRYSLQAGSRCLAVPYAVSEEHDMYKLVWITNQAPCQLE